MKKQEAAEQLELEMDELAGLTKKKKKKKNLNAYENFMEKMQKFPYGK